MAILFNNLYQYSNCILECEAEMYCLDIGHHVPVHELLRYKLMQIQHINTNNTEYMYFYTGTSNRFHLLLPVKI